MKDPKAKPVAIEDIKPNKSPLKLLTPQTSKSVDIKRNFLRVLKYLG